MLKSLDEENRLRVVDGDKEEIKVSYLVDFRFCLRCCHFLGVLAQVTNRFRLAAIKLLG